MTDAIINSISKMPMIVLLPISRYLTSIANNANNYNIVSKIFKIHASKGRLFHEKCSHT
ncbi:hypothetical protein L3BBH23_26050 [Longicatena caecimuris]|nr:hypothetical protein L3BBH23_26050 [Longicatena caecimuris]